MQQWIVGEGESGGRLDKYLNKALREAPASFLYKMLRKKNITLNGGKAVGTEILAAGDEIKLFLSDETISKFGGKVGGRAGKSFTWAQPQPGILYEDKHVLILNKPVGVLSQKARPEDSSMVEWVAHYLSKESQEENGGPSTFRPGVCNRLDRNTSGIILAGKTLYGLQALSQMLKERSVEKYYLALVAGEVAGSRRIEGYLAKKEQHNTVEIYREPREGASYICTEYEPICSKAGYTLLQVRLVTGKSHQIRAHLSSIGHPVVGDGKYGYRKVNEQFRRYHLNSQFLHSWRLVFPIGLPKELAELAGRSVEAELPEVFCGVLRHLGMAGWESADGGAGR